MPTWGRGDGVLCQVTSNQYGDIRAVQLDNKSLETGSLRVTSFARPGKLFTANRDLLVREIGVLTPESLTRIIDAVVALLRSGA